MSTRRALVWAGAIVVLAGLVLLAPRPEDPNATVALHRFLANMGYRVSDAAGPPAPGGTLILLHDLRIAEEDSPLLAWVERGGRLVVADPSSTLLDLVGASQKGPVGAAGTVTVGPNCLAPDVLGVDEVTVQASDASLEARGGTFLSCFPAGDGSYLLTRRYGAGTVTLLGGMSLLTNALLSDADNAALASQLAAPGPEVVFGPPLPPGASRDAGLWDLLPGPARVAIVAIIMASVAFVLWRGRRLGSPILEAGVSPIPASELVRATARMYRRSRAVAYCGDVLRAAFADRFSRGRGTGGGEELVPVVARASGVPESRVEEILHGPEPVTDRDLVRLGRELEEVAAGGRQEAG